MILERLSRQRVNILWQKGQELRRCLLSDLKDIYEKSYLKNGG